MSTIKDQRFLAKQRSFLSNYTLNKSTFSKIKPSMSLQEAEEILSAFNKAYPNLKSKLIPPV